MNYTFVTGMGRSGTSFLAHLLRQAEHPNTVVGHELIGDQHYCLTSWFTDDAIGTIPMLTQEKLRIERRHTDTHAFVDVNSYLRHSVESVKQVFGNVKVFHLVRDPRDVIRSIYCRRNHRDFQICPMDCKFKDWHSGDKFYRICWEWGHVTSCLLAQETTLLRFEDLLSDYDYLRSRLLDPVSIELSRQKWDSCRKRPINKTPTKFYRLIYSKLKGREFVRTWVPKYDDWSPKMKTTFEDLCGVSARAVGYSMGN